MKKTVYTKRREFGNICAVAVIGERIRGAKADGWLYRIKPYGTPIIIDAETGLAIVIGGTRDELIKRFCDPKEQSRLDECKKTAEYKSLAKEFHEMILNAQS